MSAFLGHIHYWLYRKIQLLVERENLILEKKLKLLMIWQRNYTPSP